MWPSYEMCSNVWKRERVSEGGRPIIHRAKGGQQARVQLFQSLELNSCLCVKSKPLHPVLSSQPQPSSPPQPPTKRGDI